MRVSRRDHAMIDNPGKTERLSGWRRQSRVGSAVLGSAGGQVGVEAKMDEREPTLGELMFADRCVVAQCPACGHDSRMQALYVPAPAMLTVSRCGQHLICPACGAKGLLTRPDAEAEC